MFGLFDELIKEFRPKPNYEKIVVAKPCCIPARNIITKVFNEYGVKIYKLTEKVETVKMFGKEIPALFIAEVIVSSKQAVWAEYLLLRSHMFMLWSKPKNARNLEWATKHQVMPTSWNGKPLIEKNCKEGLQALKRKKK